MRRPSGNLLAFLSVSVGFTLLTAYSCAVHAQDVRPMEGLICTSIDGVKSVMALVDTEANPDPANIIAKVNEKLGPDTCAMRRVIANLQDRVSTVYGDNEEYDIQKIIIEAECGQGVCIWGTPTEGYVMVEKVGKKA